MEFLIQLLTRDGTIRQSSSVFKYIRTMNEELPLVMPNNLPALRSLSIDSHLSLIVIARYRPLKELTIREPVDINDLDFISNCLVDQFSTTSHLKRLMLTLDSEAATKVTYALLGLSAMFPFLEELVFRTEHINTLVGTFRYMLKDAYTDPQNNRNPF